MSKIKVGVIGLGVGRSHLEGYKTHPNAEVVAVVMDILDAIYESARTGEPVRIAD